MVCMIRESHIHVKQTGNRWQWIIASGESRIPLGYAEKSKDDHILRLGTLLTLHLGKADALSFF